jgi:hypothetical protein
LNFCFPNIMEVSIMKRYFVFTVAVIAVLSLTISIYAAGGARGSATANTAVGGGRGNANAVMGGGGMGGGMGGGRGGQAGGGGMGGGRGGTATAAGTNRGGYLNVDSINTSIKAIEEQLALVKKAMDSVQTTTSSASAQNANQAGGADLQTIMDQMQKRTETIQAAATAIGEQVLVLKGSQAQIEQQAEIAELQSIITTANEERAAKTAALVQSIIDARQKEFQATATKLGIAVQSQTQRGGRGGGAGGRGGGGRGAASFTPPEGGFKYSD